jgi:RecB family exonuclease
VEEKILAEVGSLKLKGKVDRADVKTKDKTYMPDDDKQYGTVILLDYKTGNIDRHSLQLPLYAAMWQKNFDTKVEKLGHYSLKEGRVTWSPGKTTMDEHMQKALQSAEELVTQMRKGIFSPAPFRAYECRFCYHSPLCDK